MKKNETFTAVCENYTYDGMGVVRLGWISFFRQGLMQGEKAFLAVTTSEKDLWLCPYR